MQQKLQNCCNKMLSRQSAADIMRQQIVRFKLGEGAGGEGDLDVEGWNANETETGRKLLIEY